MKTETLLVLEILKTLGSALCSCRSTVSDQRSSSSKYDASTITENVLQKILEASPPFLQKFRPELGNKAFRWQFRNGSLETRKCPHETPPKIVELGVSLSNVHITPLSHKCQPCQLVSSMYEKLLTLNVSTRMFHTTKAPMFVLLPFTMT